MSADPSHPSTRRPPRSAGAPVPLRDPDPAGPPRHRRHRPSPVLLAALTFVIPAVLAVPAAAQEREGAPSRGDTADAFPDPGTRALVRRARQMRQRQDSAIHAQEVTFRERIYIGLDADRFRRERSLLRQERAARIRWTRDPDSDRVVRWLGARRETPVEEGRVGFGELDDTFSFLDPGADLGVGPGDWAVHPLADSAAFYYRYRPGDTLRIGLPSVGRTVELAEVLVEPRQARTDLVAGSFWFDTDAGVLVRAAYRPARDFTFDDVPWFLGNVAARVDYIVVEYALEGLAWWRPHRVAFQGRVDAAGMRAPLRMEWTFDDYTLNEPSSLDPTAELPEGWRRRIIDPNSAATDEAEDEGAAREGREGEPRAEERPEGAEADAEPERRTIVIVPPRDSLERSAALPEPFGAGSRPFEASDLPRLQERIERARVPAAGLPRPSFGLGPFGGLMRYNRVEALAVGARIEVPLFPRTELRGRGLVATASGEPELELGLVRATAGGETSLRVYRRLEAAGDWGAPLGLGNSLNALLLGQDDGLYYRTLGGEAGLSRSWALGQVEGRLFVERHRSAASRTDASLAKLLGDDGLEGKLAAERGTVAGLAGRVRIQNGVDPGEPSLSATAWTEGAAGDFDYVRLAGSAAVVTAPDASVAAGLEVGTGTVGGNPPPQRAWFLGGPYTVRGFGPGAARGEAFWLARAEVARSLDLGSTLDVGRRARLVAFADAGWAGPRGRFGTEGYLAGVGIGFSVLDGLLRADLAHGVHGGDEWRVHLFSDGLF